VKAFSVVSLFDEFGQVFNYVVHRFVFFKIYFSFFIVLKNDSIKALSSGVASVVPE
jgi:hypothetical protein